MPKLKSHHHDLLRLLADSGGLPLDRVDGRSLRPLRTLTFVEVEGGSIRITAAGRRELSSATPTGAAAIETGKLSRAQEDSLRRIIHERGLPASDLDQRTARALRRRGLIREEDEVIYATEQARTTLERKNDQNVRPRRGRPIRRSGRAEAILNAVDQLERILPPGAEVLVGNILAAATDVTAGFRDLARQKQDAVRGDRAESEQD